MMPDIVRRLAQWRTRWPRWLNQTIDKVIERIPESLQLRVNPAKYGFTRSQIPSPPTPPSKSVRVYIAPANFAGQGYLWARAIEHLPDVGAVNMNYRLDDGFGFPSDNPVPVRVFSRSRIWQQAQWESVVSRFNRVLIEAERPLFGALFGESVEREVEALRAAGVRVAMISHGSDLRLPSRHRELDEWSPFSGTEWDLTPVLERQAQANRALLESLDAPVFVATPDILLDWPRGRWLPIVVEPDRWSHDEPPLRSRTPIVVHAPSNGIVKGSALIEPIVQRMEQEGLLEYHRIQRTPADQMPGVYKSADIVLEQFRMGNYATTAIEAMAAGRIVVGHVHDQVREHVRAEYGVEVPVVEATPSSLHAVLSEIITAPDRYRVLAETGPSFVNTVHDGRASAHVLESFLRA